MPGDTFQLKSVAIKCLQGCWGPRHEKINGVSHSKITHCAVLISVSVMIARKYKYWFWYCIRNNLAISKYSISNPNQRLSHNSDFNTILLQCGSFVWNSPMLSFFHVKIWTKRLCSSFLQPKNYRKMISYHAKVTWPLFDECLKI